VQPNRFGAAKTALAEDFVIDRLATINPWLLYPLTILLVLAGAWAGRRLGVRARLRDADNADHLPAAQSVLLGLLSLIIGFTLNISLARWQARQTAVLHETNAIETALARTTLLPGEDAGQARALLIDYLHIRIALGAEGGRPRQRENLAQQSEVLQRRLWEEGRQATAHGMQPIPVAAFVGSLDALGEAHQERLAADYTEIPGTVVATLYGLAIVAFGYLGFVGGVKGATNLVSNAVLAVAFVTVITVVDDLDRPDAGLTAVSQRSLIVLERSLGETAAHPAS
jgi:hypothetical protein